MYNQLNYKPHAPSKKLPVKGAIIFLVLLTGLSIGCIFVYDFLIVMPCFQVKTIQVSGNQFISNQKIFDDANLTISDNMIEINPKKIYRQILQNPWIASAQIARKFPDTLHISVVEKMPLAILMVSEPLIIDNNGQVIKKQTSSDPDNLPVVTGMTYADISPKDDQLSQKMISVIRLLSEKKQTVGLPENLTITQVHVDTDFGITIWLGEPEVEILLGNGNFRKKFYRLRKLLTFFQYRKSFQQIEYIDMNNLDRIIVRPLSIRNKSMTAGPSKELSFV